MRGGWGTTKWWEKVTSSLNQSNSINWCNFHLHILHKAAKSMAKLISQLCGEILYSRLSAFQGDMEPVEGNLNTRGCLISLRNKPQQNQHGKLSASIPALIVSSYVQLLFDDEKCVYLLCVWKLAFLKSGHIYQTVDNQ